MLCNNSTGSIAQVAPTSLSTILGKAFHGRPDVILTDSNHSIPIRDLNEYIRYLDMHVKGEDRIGLYPVVDGKVKFAAVDFDSHGRDHAYKEHMQAKSLVCQQKLMDVENCPIER